MKKKKKTGLGPDVSAPIQLQFVVHRSLVNLLRILVLSSSFACR